jgi:hypothetical protein
MIADRLEHLGLAQPPLLPPAANSVSHLLAEVELIVRLKP